MMEDELLVCALEYPGGKLFCIDRGGEGIPNTSHNRQLNASLDMVVKNSRRQYFGGWNWIQSYIDYGRE